MGMRVVLTAVASGLLLLSFLLGTMLGDAAHRPADQAALPIVQAGRATPVKRPGTRSYAGRDRGMAWRWDAGRYEKVIARHLVAACESHKSGEIFREAL